MCRGHIDLACVATFLSCCLRLYCSQRMHLCRQLNLPSHYSALLYSILCTRRCSDSHFSPNNMYNCTSTQPARQALVNPMAASHCLTAEGIDRTWAVHLWLVMGWHKTTGTITMFTISTTPCRSAWPKQHLDEVAGQSLHRCQLAYDCSLKQPKAALFVRTVQPRPA